MGRREGRRLGNAQRSQEGGLQYSSTLYVYVLVDKLHTSSTGRVHVTRTSSLSENKQYPVPMYGFR